MSETRIAAVRRFNRFYTGRIGALGESLLDSKFTLTQSRLLWELAHRDRLTATDLARTLALDAGYLSRLLGGFKERGLVTSTRSTDDARHQHLSLTAAGKRAFAPLDARSHADVSALLAPLDEAQQQLLLESMTNMRSGRPFMSLIPLRFESRCFRSRSRRTISFFGRPSQFPSVAIASSSFSRLIDFWAVV